MFTSKSPNLFYIVLVLIYGLSSCGGGSGGSDSDSELVTDLSALLLSAGTINPDFNAAITEYTLVTSNSSTTITATSSQPGTRISINGEIVASGATSTPILLPLGDTTINIVLTDNDDVTQISYAISINRVSDDPTLSNLSVSAGSFDQNFSPDITEYTLLVTGDLTTVTPIANQNDATITIGDSIVNSGNESTPVQLEIGITTIDINVTAQDNSNNQTYTIRISRVGSLELVDPSPGANDQFGSIVIQLANDNIVVSDPGDSSVATNNGAVHLYSQFSSNPISSIYGDLEEDQLGSFSITALSNSNYVIVSQVDDEDGVFNAGTVRLIDGNTGEQIGPTLAGETEGDFLGNGGVTALSNSNYIVASKRDNEDGVSSVGTVRLMDGYTGIQIGASLQGDTNSDSIGGDITLLSNENYVVSSTVDDENGVVNAGSVRLIDGETGIQIGPALVGDQEDDRLGERVSALENNNYVVVTSRDEVNGVLSAGSVRLVDGNTGEQIGTTISGESINDQVGNLSTTGLPNSNFVIASSFDDEGSPNTGSVRLIDGISGDQIGPTITGNSEFDFLTISIAALESSNYVVTVPTQTVNGNSFAGSVRLIDGTTGLQISPSITGINSDDLLGVSGIEALDNNNYVIASGAEDTGSVIVDSGSVRLIDGNNGREIGATIRGDDPNDSYGSGGITTLNNNNYVVISPSDDENGITDAGSIQLIDGNTGIKIGLPITGDTQDDFVNAKIFELNSNFIVISENDDADGIVDAGTNRLIDGFTGELIGSIIVGASPSDMMSANVIKPISDYYYILSQPLADTDLNVDAGKVRIVVP